MDWTIFHYCITACSVLGTLWLGYLNYRNAKRDKQEKKDNTDTEQLIILGYRLTVVEKRLTKLEHKSQNR